MKPYTKTKPKLTSKKASRQQPPGNSACLDALRPVIPAAIATESATAFAHSLFPTNPFPALKAALASDPPFISSVLPKIVDWASSGSFTCTQRVSPTSELFTLPDYSARFILANMFLLNNPSSILSFTDLYNSSNKLAIERIKCLMNYFSMQHPTTNPSRQIIFERKRLVAPTAWSTVSHKPTQHVSFLQGTMESSTASKFVYFANKNLSKFKIGAYATQADIVFSCCPEAFLSMALFGTIGDDQVITIKNLKRYSKYSGFDKSFRYAGPVVGEERVFDLLMMDATHVTNSVDAFSEGVVFRDLAKAALAFSPSSLGLVSAEAFGSFGTSSSSSATASTKATTQAESVSIVTGHWGCGKFGGNKTHKFLQQWMAASVVNSPSLTTRLEYSVFGDVALIKFWKTIVNAVLEREWSVGLVVTNLLLPNDLVDADYEVFVANAL
ncbi:UNVERIFIED_CONTAM: hypothetical protein HDU68_001455, partial [Siphonaria sp. JEL0065]